MSPAQKQINSKQIPSESQIISLNFLDYLAFLSFFNYYESTPPNRRHKFRDAQCTRTTFMLGTALFVGAWKFSNHQ